MKYTPPTAEMIDTSESAFCLCEGSDFLLENIEINEPVEPDWDWEL